MVTAAFQRHTQLYKESVMPFEFFSAFIVRKITTFIAVGVGTVTDSKEVVLLITGQKKARALKDAVEGSVSHKCTASALQLHKNATIACDELSVGELMVNTYNYFSVLLLLIIS